jgi:hypothetical protein
LVASLPRQFEREKDIVVAVEKVAVGVTNVNRSNEYTSMIDSVLVLVPCPVATVVSVWVVFTLQDHLDESVLCDVAPRSIPPDLVLGVERDELDTWWNCGVMDQLALAVREIWEQHVLIKDAMQGIGSGAMKGSLSVLVASLVVR